MVKKIFNNQFGFSLIEILIAVSLAGGIALVMANLSLNASKTQRTALINNELNQIVNQAEKQLINTNSCRWTFGNNDSGESPAGNRLGSILPGPANAKTNLEQFINLKGFPYLQVDSQLLSPNLLLTQIKIERGDNSAHPPFDILYDHQLRVSLNFQKKRDDSSTRRSFGTEELTRHFYVDAKFSAANQVTSCLSQFDSAVETSMDIYCQMIHNSSYDIATQQCTTLKTPVFRTKIFSGTVNTNTDADHPWDYCALSAHVSTGRKVARVKRNCAIRQAAGGWQLDANFEQFRDDPRCSMVCLKVIRL